MDETRTLTETPLPRSMPLRPALFVACHPEPSQVGRHRVVQSELALGRGGVQWPSVFDDPHLSRRHARFVPSAKGLCVVDEGSHNGTRVNGQRIDRMLLAAGDVVAAGKLVLVVQNVPVGFQSAVGGELVGVGPSHARLVEAVTRAAPRSTPVLVLGEPGTGKEVTARCVHAASGRRGPFVAANCAGISDSVLQSELFGHSRGAFSGAAGPRAGLVRSASGGTLLLDEIGDASPALQAALLRLLQEGEVRGVGEDASRQVDVRIIAATNRDLDREVALGSFRRDLLDRLRRWVIEIAPLRDRREDLGPLAARFAERHVGRPVPIEPRLCEVLLACRWTGNVRQLDAIIEQAAVRSDGSGLVLGPWVDEALGDDSVAPASSTPSRPSRDELEQQLVAVGCRVPAVARKLGIGRSTLYRWLNEEGIDLDELRSR